MTAAEGARRRLRELGFDAERAGVLVDHFLDAERRGKSGHGLARLDWLETLPDLDPRARPERVLAEEGFERWQGRGALGYLTLAAVCAAQLERPPTYARVVVASDCFPTGVLGYWARSLAAAGLVAALTATSPPRLAHPDGGPPLAGTNPLAIAIPSSDGRPLVADVSMAAATYGEVLAGRARAEDIVPFGGEQAHKGFALAVGLELLVQALAGEGSVAAGRPSEPTGRTADGGRYGAAEAATVATPTIRADGSAGRPSEPTGRTADGGRYGAVLVVARPSADPVPGLRALARGLRLPGDR